MYPRTMFGPSDEVTHASRTQLSASPRCNQLIARRAGWTRMAAQLVRGMMLACLGACAEDLDEQDLAEGDHALTSTDGSASTFTRMNTRFETAVRSAPTVTSTAFPSGGGSVFGSGTTVVAFSRDPDGAWHCKGDADCNRMFSSGVCEGGILDSSCDTTSGVECWCY
jgi:hypothetical protein